MKRREREKEKGKEKKREEKRRKGERPELGVPAGVEVAGAPAVVAGWGRPSLGGGEEEERRWGEVKKKERK